MDTNEELLEVVTNYGDIAKYLIGKSSDSGCVKRGKKIGKGIYGTVYTAMIKDKPYALKRLTYKLEVNRNPEKTFEYIEKIVSGLQDKDLILLLNKKTFVNDPSKYYIPEFNLLCNQSLTYERFDNKKTVNIHGYICKMDIYPEFLLGVLCSEFLKNGQSIHFLNTFGFSTCIDSSKKLNFYFYMELINNSLQNVLKCVNEYTMRGTIVQILHSLHMLQTLQINHNDLHTSNIFLEYINDDTTFMDKKLKDILYFHYNIENNDLYIPALPFIVKIGDFGTGTKYSYPAIGTIDTLEVGVGVIPETPSEYKSSIPNWFNTSYDIITILISIFKNLIIINNNQPKQFIIKILNYIYKHKSGVDFAKSQILRDMIELGYIDEFHRPNIFTLDKDFSGINPKMLLENNNLFGDFRSKPNVSSKYILTLGKSP